MTAERPRAGARRNAQPRVGRRHRLAGVGAFDALFRSGRRREGSYLQLVSAPTERETGRAGFVIGRKVLPLAVDRNRLRRLLRVALVRARPGIDRHDVILRLVRPCRREELDAVVAEADRLLRALSKEAA